MHVHIFNLITGNACLSHNRNLMQYRYINCDCLFNEQLSWTFKTEALRKEYIYSPKHSLYDSQFKYTLHIITLTWIDEVMPVPSISSDFDISAISLRIIKCTLQRCSPNSSPGPDWISYLHLRIYHVSTTFWPLYFQKSSLNAKKCLVPGIKLKLFLHQKGATPLCLVTFTLLPWLQFSLNFSTKS